MNRCISNNCPFPARTMPRSLRAGVEPTHHSIPACPRQRTAGCCRETQDGGPFYWAALASPHSCASPGQPTFQGGMTHALH